MTPEYPEHEIGLPVRREPGRVTTALSELPTSELLRELRDRSADLVRQQVELAKTEIEADLRREAKMAGGLGVAGVAALVFATLLCVALAMALALLMPAWAATLIVAAVVGLLGLGAGLWGWNKRVRNPLPRTRRSLKEDVRWAKERVQ